MLNEKLYPIGTVVRLKGRNERYMLTGMMRLMKDGTVHDYSAVRFPLGAVAPTSFIYFNHEDVENVVFEGYRHPDFEKLSSIMPQLYAAHTEKLKEQLPKAKPKKKPTVLE